MAEAALPPLAVRASRRAAPLAIRVAFGWISLMIAIGLLADLLRPYGITTVDLSARCLLYTSDAADE